MDKSNGYEDIAEMFIKVRSQSIDGIGTSSVRAWARTLQPASAVLDLGCGTGLPITQTLINEGMIVYGIDASPTLVKIFQQNFPGVPVTCEAAEDSLYFSRKFNGIIAWGLLFLLPEEVQVNILQKAANALQPGGKLLFTAPQKKTEWNDVLTGQLSTSLGTQRYNEIIASSGLSLIEEFDDEGQNHYYHAVKV